MARQGLTRDDLVRASIELIETEGFHAFSARELAARLHIKAASLYNHVRSMDELYTEVGRYAIAELKNAQLAAIGGRRRDEAVRALAEAYYRFGKARPELYRVILSLPMVKNDALRLAAGDIVEPLMEALGGYALTETQKMHLQRVLRSIMHGFITQEEAGCFRHFPVEVEDSFRMAAEGFLLLVKNLENEVGENEYDKNGQDGTL